MSAVTVEKFGVAKNGREIFKYTLLNNNNVSVALLNYGGAVCSIRMPDKNGKIDDICLGYDDIAGYEVNQPYLGVILGRNAGRIGNGQFSLDGQTYKLHLNEPTTSLHGGLNGFSRVVWDAAVEENKVVFKYISKDGEENYPGEVTTTVAFSLDDDNTLVLDYTATTTKPCPINLSSHGYFNLAGEGYPKLHDHVVTINADSFYRLDDKLVPTGERATVENDPVDLRKPTRLGDRADTGLGLKTFDQCYCVGDNGKMKFVARVEHPPSGRFIDAHTTEPGLQFYCSHYMNNIKGKNGHVYGQYSAFCLECQHSPDSINHDNFPNTVLRPGETYRQTTKYRFGTL